MANNTKLSWQTNQLFFETITNLGSPLDPNLPLRIDDLEKQVHFGIITHTHTHTHTHIAHKLTHACTHTHTHTHTLTHSHTHIQLAQEAHGHTDTYTHTHTHTHRHVTHMFSSEENSHI